MSRITKLTALAALFFLAACSSTEEEPTAPKPVDKFAALPFKADTVREREIAPGVEHSFIWSAEGPWAVNLVSAAPGTCAPEIRTRKAGNAVRGVARTSALASAAAQELGRPVLAAINADFFEGDPYGAPVGAQVIQGEVVIGPAVDRPVFGITTRGTRFISLVTLHGELRTPSGGRTPITAANTPPEASSGIALYNHYTGARTPTDSGVVEVRLNPVSGAGAVNEGRGVVVGIDTLPAGVAIPAGGVVFAGRSIGANFLRQNVALGDTLRWIIEFPEAPGPVLEMVGGNPRLVQQGIAIRTTGSFSTTRHPRTALGWRKDGTLLLVTVDGRQTGYSVGMSLAEMSSLFLGLGAVEAVNLDGGGSTTLVIDGKVVNRYSDPAERSVGNALLLVAADAPGCK